MLGLLIGLLAAFEITGQTETTVTIAGPRPGVSPGTWVITRQENGPAGSEATLTWRAFGERAREVTVWHAGDPVRHAGRLGVHLSDGFLLLHPGTEKRLAPRFSTPALLGTNLVRVGIFTRTATAAEIAGALMALGVPSGAAERSTGWYVRAESDGGGVESETLAEHPDVQLESAVRFSDEFSDADGLTFFRTVYPNPEEYGAPLLVTRIVAYYGNE